MYYILANQADGELIQVSTEYITQGEGQIVKIREGEVPDLVTHEWHPGSLAFVPKPTSRTISKLAFMRRFTQQELGAIYTLAKTEVLVQVWMDMFRLAEEVLLDDPQIVDGVTSFETMGVLGAGRAAEILA